MNQIVVCIILLCKISVFCQGQVVRDSPIPKSEEGDAVVKDEEPDSGIEMGTYYFRNDRAWYMYCNKPQVTEEMLQQFLLCFGPSLPVRD